MLKDPTLERSELPIFTKRIQRLIKESGSNSNFAYRVGIDRDTVTQYSNGYRIPSSKTLLRICKAFNVSANWLLGLSGARSTNIRLQAVCDSTGLSAPAIVAIKRIKVPKEKSPEEDYYSGEVKMRAINKAFSSEKFLSVLCSIMMVESDESGYYEGTCSPEKGFYNVRMSPDSYAASLEFRLLHILEEVRTGNETPLESYPPYERELEAALEELRANGRIGSDENGEP